MSSDNNENKLEISNRKISEKTKNKTQISEN